MILNSLVISFWNLTKIVVLLFVIVLGLVCIITLIQNLFDNFKKRKIRSENIVALKEAFDKMAEDLQKQEEENKKNPKKARTKKVDKKEE